jgi:hypothetical protein
MGLHRGYIRNGARRASRSTRKGRLMPEIAIRSVFRVLESYPGLRAHQSKDPQNARFVEPAGGHPSPRALIETRRAPLLEVLVLAPRSLKVRFVADRQPTPEHRASPRKSVKSRHRNAFIARHRKFGECRRYWLPDETVESSEPRNERRD